MNEGERIASVEANTKHLHDCLHRIEDSFKESLKEMQADAQAERETEQKRVDEKIRGAMLTIILVIVGTAVLTGSGPMTVKTLISILGVGK